MKSLLDKIRDVVWKRDLNPTDKARAIIALFQDELAAAHLAGSPPRSVDDHARAYASGRIEDLIAERDLP